MLWIVKIRNASSWNFFPGESTSAWIAEVPTTNQSTVHYAAQGTADLTSHGAVYDKSASLTKRFTKKEPQKCSVNFSCSSTIVCKSDDWRTLKPQQLWFHLILVPPCWSRSDCRDHAMTFSPGLNRPDHSICTHLCLVFGEGSGGGYAKSETRYERNISKEKIKSYSCNVYIHLGR